MPLEDITNNRPSNYSLWRRSLRIGYCTDGDWFEQKVIGNKLVIVAYIETIQIPNGKSPLDYPVWDSKVCLAEEISDKMNIPSYYIWHNKDCSHFFVQNSKSNKIIKMFENEYKQFIRNIGDK